MPCNYEFLLKKILKTEIIENKKTILEKKNNISGVPQGGVLSPLLMNWALDGIENLIFETADLIKSPENVAYYDPEKLEYYKKRDVENLRSEAYYKKLATVELKYTSWMIRYADDFIIGVKGEAPLIQIRAKLEKFLGERGLALSEEKTEIKKWKRSTKIDFLSWTFHYLMPKRVNWIIKISKNIAGRLTDWSGLYIYPAKKAVT